VTAKPSQQVLNRIAIGNHLISTTGAVARLDAVFGLPRHHSVTALAGASPVEALSAWLSLASPTGFEPVLPP
jgi:hypothetical protein